MAPKRKRTSRQKLVEAERIKKKRQRPEYHRCDQALNTVRMQRVRQIPEKKKQEQSADTSRRKNVRQDEEYRSNEQSKDTTARRDARQHSEKRLRDNESKQLKSASWDMLLSEYRSAIEDGPMHLCSSCCGLWFQKSLKVVSPEYLANNGCTKEFVNLLLQKRNNLDMFALCGTCYNTAMKKELPRLNISNGFGFPTLPDTLTKLNTLEERLVSPRIPFMQVRNLGMDKQKGLRGNVVNIENDLDIYAKVLPRNIEDTSTVQVMLMRRMRYKAAYLFQTVRPKVVFEAANFFCNSELYRSEGITLSDHWIRKYAGDICSFVTSPSEASQLDTESRMEATIDTPDSTCLFETEFDSDEDDLEQVNPGADETLILAEGQLVKIAPGEGKLPLPWLTDLNAEQLSFPSIYGGIPRKFKKGLKISYTDIVKSETRMFDRRACKPELLYSAKRLQNERVASAMNICVRKKKSANYTAGQLAQDDQVSLLVGHDDGFRCLRGIRSSPAVWENQQKKVLAMIRQTFLPTFFITLSAAETKWTELLVNLELVLNGNKISQEEAMNLSYEEKAELIRNDPVTCALYFDHRLRCFLNLLVNKKDGVFSPYTVEDHYNKIEFAHRGSAHNHGLFWLNGAPSYDSDDQDSITKCVQFIDKHITCRRNGDVELEEVIKYQIHKHSHTCKQRTPQGTWKCRFNLPLPPMPDTRILTPLLKDSSEYKQAVINFQLIHSKLKEMGRGFKEDLPFKEFLASLKLEEDEYILAVRSSTTREKVFLARRTCDIFVNAYNEKILKTWKANMDIQFILDPYACVTYCITYLTKSCGGMSKLLRDVQEDLRRGNKTLQEKIRTISNKFINAVEISAQEAAYMVLSLHLTNSSREDIFINTIPLEERVQLLKPQDELKEMDPKSHDIFVCGVLDHYTKRPVELEDTCLAEFASKYTFSTCKPKYAGLQLLDGSGYIKVRSKSRIIRYRRYHPAQDSNNYHREQLMLFMPWRNESLDLVKINTEVIFQSKKDLIIANRNPYDPNHTQNGIEELVDMVLKDIEANDNTPDNVDPDFETDIFVTAGKTKPSKKFEFLMPPKQIEEDQYLNMVRTLNDGQQKYFLHLVHKIKTRQTPLHDFIFGMAGVGKSHLITCIVQYLLRHLTKEPGYSLDSIPVLVCAPTGKAAFNIFGMTLHAAFCLPPFNKKKKNGEFPISSLPDDICNSLRVKYKNLILIIIDEISMVSVVQLFQLNARLQQIMGNNLPFGGVSVLVVGDFYQIRPYKGQFVFQVPKNIPFGFIIGNELWSKFSMYELTQIMRQDKALHFAQAVNNMARGCMTDDDIMLIKPREINKGLTPPSESLHLFWSNEECLLHNTEVHQTLNTEWAISEAFDVIHGNITDQEREDFLHYVKTLPAQDTDGLASKVRLQVGAQYMVSTNVNVSDGIFNGSTGKLVHIAYSCNEKGEKIANKIYLKFDCPVVGSETRASDNSARSLGFDITLTPIGTVKKPLNKIGYDQGLTVYRTQIPVLAANGITIMKCQGASRYYIVLHCRPGLTRDLLYVGCSRTFTPDGLFIDGIFHPPGPPPQYLTDEIERLKSSPLKLSLRFLQDTHDSYNKLIFHNVQSLHKHYLDIVSDHCFMSSDIMCFVEPWTLPSDTYEFKDYSFVKRQDSSTTRSSFGSVLVAKVNVENYTFSHQYSSIDHFSFTIWSFKNVVIFMVYKSPAFSPHNFLTILEEKLQNLQDNNLIVFGDFNLNHNSLASLFSKYGLQFILPVGAASTDGMTQIDLCYTNFLEAKSWYYESIFSYHKPICVVWPKEDNNLTKFTMEYLTLSLDNFNLDKMSVPISVPNTNNHHVEPQCQSQPMELTVTDSQPMELEVGSIDLPEVTVENASQPYWHVYGITLALNDLKTLTSCSSQELHALHYVAQITNDAFLENYLTDGVVYSTICILTAEAKALVIPPATTELVLTSNYDFGVEPGQWNEYEYVYIPIHYNNHWMLLVVQPKTKSIQFYDPASSNIHPCTNILLRQIEIIIQVQNLSIQNPNKCHQQDGYNCGIYICKYVQSITTGCSLEEQFDAVAFRQEVLQALWMNSEERVSNLS